jgi:hypothetical protein
MISLEKYIESIDFTSGLEKVNSLISNGVSTGFDNFENPAIQIAGFSGTVSVDSIANQVLKAGEIKCKKNKLTLADRMAGIELVKKLQLIYLHCDQHKEAENQSNGRKFLSWCSEIYNSTTRFKIEEFGETCFLAFSPQEFQAEFGGQINNSNPNYEGLYRDKIVVRHASIERKYQESLKTTQKKSYRAPLATPVKMPNPIEINTLAEMLEYRNLVQFMLPKH